MGHRLDCQQSFSNNVIFYKQATENRVPILAALVRTARSRHDKDIQRRRRTESGEQKSCRSLITN